MHKQRLLVKVLIMLLTCFAMTFTWAQSAQTRKLAEFEKEIDAFFKSKPTKHNLKERFEAMDKRLKSIMLEFRVLDFYPNPPESVQATYEFELLDPLRILAQSQLKKDDCASAKHLNLLSGESLKEPYQVDVDKVIRQVCR